MRQRTAEGPMTMTINDVVAGLEGACCGLCIHGEFDKNEASGRCLRHAPRPVWRVWSDARERHIPKAQWPLVDVSDRCGEFVSDPAKVAEYEAEQAEMKAVKYIPPPSPRVLPENFKALEQDPDVVFCFDCFAHMSFDFFGRHGCQQVSA